MGNEFNFKMVGKNANGWKSVAIKYDGPLVSLNQYKSLHWRKLKKKIDQVKKHFWALYMEQSSRPKFQSVTIWIQHNTDLDIDNIVGTTKPCLDVLRKIGAIPDDDKRYFTELLVQYRPFLEKGTIHFIFYGKTI